LTNVGRLAIDIDPSGKNPFLDFAPRAVTGISQRFLQFRRVSEYGLNSSSSPPLAAAWNTVSR
jgi:hypothetical protein